MRGYLSKYYRYFWEETKPLIRGYNQVKRMKERRTIMKKTFALILALALSLPLTACGSSPASSDGGDGTDETITLRVSVQQNENHETCKAVRRIAEKVETETNGGLKLDIYSDSVLGDYTAVFDEVRMGTIDMAVQSFSGQYDPAFEIGYLPYLFTNYEDASKVLGEGSNTYQMISDKCDENGLVFLGYFAEGFVQIGMVEPVDNMGDPDAPKTQLIRCPAIESGRLAMDCQGFATVTIPYTDLYTAMQTGVCDGWMGGTAELNYVGFRDLIKYLYVVNQQMENNSGIVNKEKFSSLPQEYQTILMDAFAEETAASFDRARDTDEANLALLEDYGVEIVELTQDELDAVAEKVRTETWDKDFELYGEDARAAVYADMGW